MRSHHLIPGLAAVSVLGGALLAPIQSIAQPWRDAHGHSQDRDRRDRDHHSSDYNRRQQTKNEWRNLAIGAGALGVLGLLKHDNTLTFTGAAGALYSTYRYEQDRKSQNKTDRLRAEYFSRPYFYRDGTRYTRETVTQHGKKYYRFHRDR